MSDEYMQHPANDTSYESLRLIETPAEKDFFGEEGVNPARESYHPPEALEKPDALETFFGREDAKGFRD